MRVFDILYNTRYRLLQGQNAEIKSLTIDSRRATRGSMFFCIKGLHSDGHTFVSDVIERHAAAIVCEDDVRAPDDVTVVKVEDVREALSYAAANFYGRPADGMDLVGVTGTNGKTSTTYFMESVLNAYGKKAGVIGTVEFRIGGSKLRIHTATSTTPDTIELQQILRQMSDGNADCTVMEVTSHALALRKVDGLHYKVGIFTNLTQDHLDFHGSMEAYRDIKAKLFAMCEHSVINADDPSAEYMIEKAGGKTLTFGIQNACDLQAKNLRLLADGCRFTVAIDGVDEAFFIPVPGRFTVYNGLGVIGAALCLGIPVAYIRDGLEYFGGVPGRIQPVKNKLGFDVVVDYAHTPDGLENIIAAVREITRGKVITVFGCGGDRDRAKRPIMGRIAGTLSDRCVITSDNPRTEEPDAIIAEIEQGMMQTSCAYEKQADRRLAIRHALALATPGDSVIIAGKGHENYQIFADRTLHFDDMEEAADAIKDIEAETMTISEAARATGGTCTGGDMRLLGVSTDSRRIARGSLFVALAGERFDGHDFIEQAFAAGAAACMTQREAPDASGPVIQVGSTAKALLDLAEYHRHKFDVPVVAVTGSAGKTTTKDMIVSMLSQKFHVLHTAANENNEIGLPLTVLRLTRRHECAVLEMGMNHAGEISRMSKAARPDLCVITNIGMAHAGYLGGREGVLRAKSEIFDYANPQGLAILNGDDDLLAGVDPPCARYLYGFGEHCELRAKNLRGDEAGGSLVDIHRQGSVFTLRVPLPGKHMVYDALAAVAVGIRLGLSVAQICKGIETFTPSGNRMETFDSPWGFRVINDSYNANTESMYATIDVLADTAGVTACILGDMKELGAFSEAEHGKVGRCAVEKNIDVILFVGEESRAAYAQARQLRQDGVYHFADTASLMLDLRTLLKPAAAVLVKGSRAMRLDEVADAFRNV